MLWVVYSIKDAFWLVKYTEYLPILQCNIVPWIVFTAAENQRAGSHRWSGKPVKIPGHCWALFLSVSCAGFKNPCNGVHPIPAGCVTVPVQDHLPKRLLP